MITRDPRVGDGEVLLHLAPNGERRVIEKEGFLLAALYEDQAGEDPRANPRTGAAHGNADDGLSR